jgi:hypothetical protein
MTERKPFGVPYETWVDRLVREAQERGDFDNLPKGKPLKNLDRPWTIDDWAREMMKREGVSVLPPALELRRTVETTLENIMELALEEGVRKAVNELNDLIRRTNRSIAEGPASTVFPLKVEEVVERWRLRRNKP